MKKEKKNSVNKWVLRISTMLLILILSLCSALSYGIWRSSENSISKATEGQISLAWLKESEFLPNNKSDTQLYPYSQLQETYAAADSSTYVDSVDARFQCMAHAGLNTVVSDECGISVHSSVDKPYKDSVIVGTCTEIEFKSLSHKTVDTGKIQCFGYVVTIKIDKDLSPVLDPDYPYSYVRIMSSQVMADFSDFFIVGSKYIINGTVSYLPSPLKEDQAPYFTLAEADISLPTTDVKFEEDMYEKIGISTKTKISTLGGVFYDLTSCYLDAYSDPSYLSYAKIGSSLEESELLSSDGGNAWNSIITRKKMTKESVKIITANDIMSIPIFSSGRAHITEGIAFTEEDYLSGRKLCLISSQLADSNNITVGDILDMKFWSNGYTLNTGASWSPNPYKPGSDFLDEGSYTVAGIYEDDEAWDTQCFGITPNTVIIPEASVSEDVKMQSSLTDLGGDRYTGMPDSRAYILKSGKASAFETEMEAKGYGGMFYYYEQVDPSLPNLNSLSDKSRVFTYISASALAVAVVSMAVYAFVKTIRSEDKKARLRAVLTVIIISSVSILISAVICFSFYGSIMDAANESITAGEASLQELKTEPSLPAPEPVSDKTTLDRTPSLLLMAFAIQTGTLLLILCISSALCLIIKGGKKIEKTKIPYRLKNGRGIKGGMPAVIWYSITQSARSAVTGTLMIVLVSLSSIFMFLSVSTWLTARSSISEAQKAYTTIAVAAENEFVKDIGLFENGTYDYSSLTGLYEAAENSEHVEYSDIRDRCMAYNSSIKTTTSGMSDEYSPIPAVDYPYDLSVVVGTCVSVKYIWAEQAYDPSIDELVNRFGYDIVLEIDRDESPALDEDYAYSRYIHVITDQIPTDISDCYQVGERYILYGSKRYSQYPKTEMYRDKPVGFNLEIMLPGRQEERGVHMTGSKYYELVKFEPYMHEMLGTDSSTTIVRTTSGGKIEYNIEDCYFHAYKDDANVAYAKLDGTLEDFLLSDKGQKWNRWIEECQITVSSLKMNFTENLDSVLLFNQGLAYITEGRTFTEQEYSEGAKVCIISAETARDSGIKVGDKIDFSFWSNGYTLTDLYDEPIWQHTPYGDGCGFIEESSFEVIGIYKAEDIWNENEFFLTPNNAFAPKGSIEGLIAPELPEFYQRQYNEEKGTYNLPLIGQYQSISNTHSYVIKPGHIEAFEKEMESLGYGGMFYYYDQGYSMISPVLDSLKESTSLLMYVSVAVWAVILSAFFIIMASRNRKTAGIMMSLGTKRNQIFVHMLSMLMCVIIISSLAGGIAGYFMYDGIVGKIYEEAREDNVNLEFSSFKTDQSISGTYDSSLIESFDLKKSPQSVLMIGGIQLIFLSSASAVMAKRYSMMEPLALLKGAGRIKGRRKK
ncbi:MAG: ABC transporter permease [Clostridia bacterium]|nr:ABC transporter permease [Clostridia bacterium]